MKPSASSRKPGPVATASPVGTSPTIPAFAGATTAASVAATPTELPPLSEDEAEVTERLLPPPDDSLDVTDTVETKHGDIKSGHLFVKNRKAVAKPALQNNTEVLQVVNETMSPSQNKLQVHLTFTPGFIFERFSRITVKILFYSSTTMSDDTYYSNAPRIYFASCELHQLGQICEYPPVVTYLAEAWVYG